LKIFFSFCKQKLLSYEMPFEKPRWFNGVIGDPAKPSKKPKKKQLVAELESIRTSVGKQLLKLNSDRPRPSFQAAENEEGHDTDTSLQQLVGLLLEWYNEDLQELERCKEKAKDLEQKQRSGIEGDENEGGLRNSSVIKHPEDDQALKSAWLRGETEGKRVNQEEWQRYRDEVENIKIPQEYERGRGDGAKEEYDRWQTRYKALQAKFKQRQDDDLREIEEQQTTIKTLETGRNEEQRRYDEKMSNTNRQHLKNMEELREQHDKKLGQTLQDHATRMDTETRRYQNEVKRLQGLHDQQIAESQCEIETMQQDHKAHKTRIQQELEAKDESQRTQLTGLKQTHAAATKILKQHHEREIARMAAEHSHRVQRLEAANFAIKTQMGQEISDLKEKHTTELEALEQGYNQKVSHMKDAYATQVETMQTKHTEAQTHLREQVQSFSGALLTRDIRDFTMLEMEDLKALSDNDIRSRFELLKQDVDSFARLDWKPNPKHWTNQIVKRLSSNQRVLKKHILQDIIWTSLHAFIFCSPFRLFGEEGEALELQWNERCGKGKLLETQVSLLPKC
jgi:hypothetical protein